MIDIDDLVEDFKKYRPRFYSLLYPRKYRLERHYGRPEALPIIGWSYSEKRPTDNVEHIATVGCILLKKFKVPTYCLGRDLMSAFLRTHPPEDTKLKDIKLPFDAFLLLLPNDTLKAETGFEANFIIVSKVQGTKYRDDDLGVKIELELENPNPGAEVITVSVNQTVWKSTEEWGFTTYALTLPIDDRSISSLWTAKFGTYHKALSPEETNMMRSVFDIVVNSLLIMDNNASYSETAKCIIPPIVHGKGETIKEIRPALFEPRWIGRHYRIQRESQGGHHASPIAHWRQGHWKNVAYGPKHSLRKRQFIEPVFVGAQNQNQKEKGK